MSMRKATNDSGKKIADKHNLTPRTLDAYLRTHSSIDFAIKMDVAFAIGNRTLYDELTRKFNEPHKMEAMVIIKNTIAGIKQPGVYLDKLIKTLCDNSAETPAEVKAWYTAKADAYRKELADKGFTATRKVTEAPKPEPKQKKPTLYPCDHCQTKHEHLYHDEETEQMLCEDCCPEEEEGDAADDGDDKEEPAEAEEEASEDEASEEEAEEEAEEEEAEEEEAEEED